MSYVTIELVALTCCHEGCGCVFGMEAGLKKILVEKADSGNFYCTNGHAQCFRGESVENKIARLECQRIEERDKRLLAEAAQNKLEVKHSRMKARIKAGVCTDCNRTFQNLKRHMTCKHPGSGRRRGKP